MERLPNCLIDLHLHLDGSLSPKLVRELAALQGISIPAEESALLEMLTVGTDCSDLNTYLEKFAFPCSLLQTEAGLTAAASGLLAELSESGFLYAEIRFAPQKSTDNGLTQKQAVEAVIKGMKSSSLRSGLILCCMRGSDNTEENFETVRLAGDFLGQGVCAVDLAGAEALYPTGDFEDLFAYARELGVPFTIHAGEAAGAESVGTALQFGAKRIGHGVRSSEDQAVMKRLAETGVVLELCPTSNLNTAVYGSIKDYPLRKLMTEGVRVTVNTDNTTVSATSLRKEFGLLRETFSLTDAECCLLLLNAAEAAFTDPSTKEFLRHSIESAFLNA